MPGFLRGLEKPGKNFFWSVGMEEGKSFPDLIFRHTFS